MNRLPASPIGWCFSAHGVEIAVTGEDAVGHIVYNRLRVALTEHCRFLPRSCRPYRPKTKGNVERPFSDIRQDFF